MNRDLMENLSIRRLLACVNVSVFDGRLSPLLTHRSRQFRCRKPQTLFRLFLLSVGMWTATFAACRGMFLFLTGNMCPFCFPFPVAFLGTGLCLLLCALSVCALTASPLTKRFVWIYVLTGELIFLKGLSLFWAPLAPVAAFVLFFLIGQDEDNTFRQTSTVLIFCYFLGKVFYDFQIQYAPLYIVSLTAPLGWLATLFPVKRIRWERAGFILTFFPPAVLAATDMFALATDSAFWKTTGCGFLYVVLTAVTLFLLRDEMTGTERKIACKWLTVFCFAAFVLPAGLIASAAICFIGWLIDSRAVAAVAAAFAFLFALTGVLGLSLSFAAAGGMTAAVAVALFFVRKRTGAMS